MMTILEMLLALILLILAVSVFSALIMTVAGVLYQRNLDKKMPPQTVEATVVAKSQSDPPTHRRGAGDGDALFGDLSDGGRRRGGDGGFLPPV